MSDSPRRHKLKHLNPVRTVRVVGRLVRRATLKPGSAPGTLVHTGPKKVEEVRIRFIDYDRDEVREKEVERVEDTYPFRDSPTVSWVNVEGLHDVAIMEKLRDHFGFHPLMMEDIVHVGQRPKFEEYEPHLFVVLSMILFDEEEMAVEAEQMALIVGPNFVFTFQERPGDVFDPVRDRIRGGRPQIREGGPDYLAYALIDAVVDSYFQVLEKMGDQIEIMENAVMDDPTAHAMEEIHHLKREMLVVRRAVWPLREALGSLVRDDSPLISEKTRLFLRDVYDHAVQVIDTVETLRDVLSGMMDLYLSAVGQRTNEVMKVLTIMASIFIPLTFLAGIYGMNFEHMPELGYPWAYPALLGLMLAIGLGMLWYFRRKGWI